MTVLAQGAAVVSPHHLATRAGEQVLASGGNAVDAAVAVSAALGVVYPHMTGLGGDSFWLGHGPDGLFCYNGSGRAGHRVTLDAMGTTLPLRGARAVLTVPGTVAAYADVLAEHGTQTLREVLAPAITLAEAGYEPSPSQLADLARLLADPDGAVIAHTPYAAARAGQLFRQPDLARSLQAIADGGAAEFCRGSLAERLVAGLHAHGGLLDAQDFAAHHGEWTTPISTTYHDLTVVGCPPNSQGFVLLLLLKVLEHVDVGSLDPTSGELYALLIRAVRLVFPYRNAHLGDPNAVEVPTDRMLSDELARELAGRLLADDDGDSRDPAPALGGDTAYAAVTDGHGTTVSFIQSLYFEYGSAFVPPGTGVLLHNRGALFSTDPASPNALAPGRRPFHTLMPSLAFRAGQREPWLTFGTMGGDGQAQTQLLVLLLLHHFGRTPQEALAHPRFLWGRTWGAADVVAKLEPGVGAAALAHVQGIDSEARVVSDNPSMFGHAHVIQNSRGTVTCGIDPRSDGAPPHSRTEEHR
ncbi:MAG: gamma-glutamyltransferase family protein [Cellulomonadaceae bacterium]